MSKDYDKILTQCLNEGKYLTNEDLRINRKYSVLFSRLELEEFLNFKDVYKSIKKVEFDLKTFNSKNIYFFFSKELTDNINDYLEFLSIKKDDDKNIIIDNYDEIILSQIASELEGTLRIEGINTTRKQILNIIQSEEIISDNDKIIYNMYNGYKYILQRPIFNKENFLYLYKLLSFESLKEEDLTNGYRNDMVYISNHQGAPVELLDESMDSLFKFVNDNLSNKNIELLLPFIVHYYILYIHPFFDFNGRTARMCSIWLSFLLEKEYVIPTYLSEGINDDKTNYYKAIDDSRNSHNDLTYFLTYLTRIANKYYLVYKNINNIKEKIAMTGETLSVSELYYLKKIIINSNKGWFNYKGFIEFSNLDITKQGAFKILNKFLKLDILLSKINSKNEKIFILNDSYIEFAMDSN